MNCPTTNRITYKLNIERLVVVEGRPSTTPSKPCARLSTHTKNFPLSVAVNALGQCSLLLLRVKTVAMIPKEFSQARVSLEVKRKAHKRAEPPVESLCGRGNLNKRFPRRLLLIIRKVSLRTKCL